MLDRIFLVLTLTTCLLPFNSQAEEIEKKVNLSFGTYALTVAYVDAFINDDILTGTALSASYAFSNNTAVRGSLFSLNHIDYPEIDAEGIDIIALFGTGFTTQGFKAYLGAGIYDESWDNPTGGVLNFSGIQFNGGLGYNWEAIALDLIIGIRESGDYNNQANADTAVVSSTFNLSVRF